MNAESEEETKSTESSAESANSQERPRRPARSSEEGAPKRKTSSSAPRREAPARREGSASRSGGDSPAKASSEPRRAAPDKEDTSRPPRRAALSAVQASRKAMEQFSGLTGRSAESVVGVHKTDEGWNVKLEVVESRRIPDTADLLAEYDVNLNSSGELLSYDRLDRYVRGRPTA